MRAKAQTALPRGAGWWFEPKWDGFRALAWGAGAEAEGRLESRRRRDLLPFFPELSRGLASLPAGTVLDGEIVVVRDGACDFEALQRRLSGRKARAEELASALPASFAAFDLLAQQGDDYLSHPYEDRREALERLQLGPPFVTTPVTTDRSLAQAWLTDLLAAGCEGVVAKHARGRYEPGLDRWIKVKQRHTIDVVVGGVRLAPDDEHFEGLLLGLYDDAGALQFVGLARGLPSEDGPGLLDQFRGLEVAASFDGRTPDQERGWGHRRGPWFAVRPIVVAEVSADQIAGGVLRHGARFLRWRSDKAPAECLTSQLHVGAGRFPGADG